MRSVVLEASIKGSRNKWLHSTVSAGWNYLSMTLIPASGTTLPIHHGIFRPKGISFIMWNWLSWLYYFFPRICFWSVNVGQRWRVIKFISFLHLFSYCFKIIWSCFINWIAFSVNSNESLTEKWTGEAFVNPLILVGIKMQHIGAWENWMK